MQYILIFLAVLAVILCMNVFIFLAVRQAADKVKEQVEGRFMDERPSLMSFMNRRQPDCRN